MANIEKLVGSESRLELGQKINEIIGNKANKDLTNTGVITNCITEIPQRIKLELNNGTLTLKAGSQVIIPNGFEADGVTPKFDYVTLQNDLGVSTGAGQNVLFVKFDGSAIPTVSLARATSGNTDVLSNQTYHAWYDTKNNIVKRYGSDASTYIQVSFPIVIATFADATTCNNIDQVFNGFGYIGSTVWVDKGVKGLIPNGRNEDGTLKNIEYTPPKILMYDLSKSFHVAQPVTFIIENDNTFGAVTSTDYLSGYTLPSTVSSQYYHLFYNIGENKHYRTSGSTTANWKEIPKCVFGNAYFDGTNITNFNTKLPFKAVDYNDLAEVKNNMLTATMGKSNNGYCKFSNGLIIQWGQTPSFSGTTTVTLPTPFTTANYRPVATPAAGGDYDANWDVRDYTTTSFRINQPSSGSKAIAWHAIGY